MDNIRYGRLDATDEEVYAAARLANADGLSGTLRTATTQCSQQTEPTCHRDSAAPAIARAAVADPPVLILTRPPALSTPVPRQ